MTTSRRTRPDTTVIGGAVGIAAVVLVAVIAGCVAALGDRSASVAPDATSPFEREPTCYDENARCPDLRRGDASTVEDAIVNSGYMKRILGHLGRDSGVVDCGDGGDGSRAIRGRRLSRLRYRCTVEEAGGRGSERPPFEVWVEVVGAHEFRPYRARWEAGDEPPDWRTADVVSDQPAP
jgi:hypothetical protein